MNKFRGRGSERSALPPLSLSHLKYCAELRFKIEFSSDQLTAGRHIFEAPAKGHLDSPAVLWLQVVLAFLMVEAILYLYQKKKYM